MRNHAPHRPPHRQATSPACLGPEGFNPHFPHSISTLPLLMPLLLYRTVVLRPFIVPDRRPCICGPVPHSRHDPLSFHVDSRLSFLTIRPCVPMSYEAQ